MWQLAVWVTPTVIESPYDTSVSKFLESVGTTVESRFLGIHWIVDEVTFACPTLIIWDPTYWDGKAALDRLNAIEEELTENLGGIETSVDRGEPR